MKENDTKRMNDMKTSVKSILPLLVAIVSIFIGIAFANGENVTNITIDPSATVTNVTIDPNVTMPIPTQVATPNVTIAPVVTAPMPTSVVTPNITADVTPNITISPIITAPIPTPVATPNITVVPTVTMSVPIQVTTPNIASEPNKTIVSTPVTDQNATQGTISNVVPAILSTRKPIYTSKQMPDSTQAAVSITTTGTSANGSNQKGFLGDIYDKIIVAAILGLVGLVYEIIKIKYEHKQKAKAEQLNEDAQNKLLEKLERRQEELLARQGIPDKRQEELLNKLERRQEDIDDQNNKI